MYEVLGKLSSKKVINLERKKKFKKLKKNLFLVSTTEAKARTTWPWSASFLPSVKNWAYAVLFSFSCEYLD